jgi:AsmA protein
MKKALLFLGGLAVLLFAAAVAIPFIVDPDAFRPLLESRLTASLGREVKLGDLKLSILRGSVGADDLSIAEDPKFGKTPFLKAKSLAVQVEMGPLITSRQLKVTGITIDQPEIILIQTTAGQWNVSTLGAAASNVAKDQKPAASADAASSGKLDLTVHKIEITKGNLTLIDQGEGLGKPRQLQNVELSATDFSETAQFPFTFSGHIDTGGDLKLDGKAGPVNDMDASLTPAQAHYTLSGFDLAASRLFDATTGIRGLVSAEGDTNWKGGSIEGKGVVRADKLIFAKAGSPSQKVVELDFDVNHDSVRHSGTIGRGGIHIGKAVADLTGSYSLRGAVPTVNMNLAGSKLPIDELAGVLPALDVQFPKGSSLKGGLLTIAATSVGPLNKLVTKGTIEVDKTTLQNFDLGAKMRALEALAGIRASANTEFSKITAKIMEENDATLLESVNVTATGIGELTGSGTIGAQKELNLKMAVNLHTSGGLIEAAGHKGDTGLAFIVGGTVDNPTIHPDMKSVVKVMTSDSVQKAATGLLNNLLNKNKKPSQ